MTRIVENRAGVLVSAEAVEISTGFGDAGRIPQLDAAGLLDPSLFPGSGLSINWGDINGTLSDQTDLQAALDAKIDDSQAGTFGLSFFGTATLGDAKMLLALAKVDVGLGNVDNTSDVNKPVSTAQAAAIALKIDLTQKAAAGGVATLDGAGLIPTSQLPALAITKTYVVASQAAQLALVAQEGDVAVRSDQNKSYIQNGGTAGTMADWTELLTPTDTVLSVNGETGAVSLVASEIPSTATGSIVATNVQAAIAELEAEKQPLDADLTTWAGITPGANVGAFLATPSSANLLAALTTSTGTGNSVFSISPTFTGTTNFALIASANGLQITGYTAPSAGAGLELNYQSGEGIVQAYDRTGGAWKPVAIRGSIISIRPSATEELSIGAVGNYLNDVAAAIGGVPVKGMYRNGSILMIRVA